MAREGTQQVPAFKHNGRHLQDQPEIAQSGWINFLTWRKPKASTSVINSDSNKSPPSQNQTRAARSRYSPQSGHQQISGRSRAAIPFNIGPRRTPSSTSSNSINDIFTEGEGSTSVLEVENDLGVVFADEDDEDDILPFNSAFQSLSRVRRKAKDDPRSTFQGTRNPSSSSQQISSSVDPSSSSPDTVTSSSWLAWGSFTIRSTLPRNVVPSLFSNNSTKESNNVFSSPNTFSNTNTVGAISSEKWRPMETDDVDRYVDRMIGFAGIDGSSRSIVTLSAPNLPPADQVSHDKILQRILLRTQPLVENPGGYTLILFASGADVIDGSHGSKTTWPGWTWCWKAWRSLGRSYRKNLKRLYIIHPTFFTKTLVRLISTGSYFVSPKFAKKIVQCDALKDLDKHIPLHQLDIPPEVLIWDLKMGAKEESEETTENDDIATIPTNVRDCIEALKQCHNTECLLDIEGIFRIPPSNALLRSAKYAYRLNRRPNLARFVEKDVHLPAALLKSSLRSLPLPLFPSYLYPSIERCPTTSEEDMLQYLRQSLFPTLDEGKLILLSYILQCLHEVSLRSDKNRMDSFNLSIVITPNLVRSADAIKDVMMCRVQKIPIQSLDNWEEKRSQTTTATLGSIIAFCISNYYQVFDEVDLDLPVLNFETDQDQKRDSLGTLSSTSKKVFVHRNFPNTSSPLQQISSNNRNGIISTYSPSTTKTLSNKQSSSSLRVKNRITSGGSLRAGVNLVDKGIQSIALVGTSATGEIGKSNIIVTRPSLEMEEFKEDDGDYSLQNIQASPTMHSRKLAPIHLDGLNIRHDRRPLSEVFEE